MAFRYYIVKKSVGETPYTTRPSLGTRLTQKELTTEVESSSSLTEGDLLSAFSIIGRLLLDAARNGRSSELLFGLFRIGLSCGGAIDDPEAPLDKDDISPRMTIYLSSSIQNDFYNNLTIERVGIAGEKVPDINLVRNMETENFDTYTPGSILRVTGEDLKIVKSDSQQGVFLVPEAGGEERRMSIYSDNTDGKLTFLVPTDISGPQTLTVRVKYGDSLRENVYPITLTQE